MKEYFRKPYLSRSYREMMTKKTNADVWTKIIESHSQFEKPYLPNTTYGRMQHFHPIMPGLSPTIKTDLGGFEFPFDPHDPSTWPWDVSFFCHTYPCYCADETKCIDVGCAYPIIGVILRSGCEGMSAEVSGTQICITAPSSPPSFCRIDIIMAVPANAQGLPAGLTGDHSAILVDECSDCVDCGTVTPVEYDYDASAATVARENSVSVFVKDGAGPYDWTVSGTGFTLDNATTSGLGNTLNADASACGSATITITDQCENVATGYVRCTTGVWGNDTQGCILSGAFDSIVNGYMLKKLGKYNQIQHISPENAYGYLEGCAVCPGYCSSGNCINCTDCLTWTCDDYSTGWLTCGDFCCTPFGTCVDTGGFCMCNRVLFYQEWICA